MILIIEIYLSKFFFNINAIVVTDFFSGREKPFSHPIAIWFGFSELSKRRLEKVGWCPACKTKCFFKKK
jgi:hypothetical protein